MSRWQWYQIALGAGTATLIAAMLWLASDAATTAALLGGEDRCIAEDAAPKGDGPAGMVWVNGGTFEMGSDVAYPEERPARPVTVEGFWISRHEITNAQFKRFVEATGYRTVAERRGESVVFTPPAEMGEMAPRNWWRLVDGANWRHPIGPESSLQGRMQYPVVHIAYDDAAAYAEWRGARLPSEAQFEYAAAGGGRQSIDGEWTANTWQGAFPVRDRGADGHAGLAPVGCYATNEHGLYDMIGNVWEWTASRYTPSHAAAAQDTPAKRNGLRRSDGTVKVIKGGSFLCAPNYCSRYRPEARQPQDKGLGTSHIGFRIVMTAENGGSVR